MILSAEECGCALVDEGLSIANSPICSGTILFMILLEGFIKGRCDIATPCKTITSVDEVEEYYDFIVVGAGSAGSIVAGRLSENGSHSVLLLEAGGQEPIGARVPSFYRTFWSNKEVDWDYRTVVADYCLDQNEKGCLWPRGKVLGGSSLLNGMMYHRGHQQDYEDWVQAGATGWSWEDNLPYFAKSEGNKEIGTLVSANYHSDSGAMPIQRFNYQSKEVYDLLDAINETGIPIIADMNDPNTPEGFTIAQAFNDDGQRFTTARVYLKPKSERPNLSVKLNAHVSRVIIEDGEALGVEYIDETGQTNQVFARKEVILSAGALNSPHILLLSGIGPKETLEKFDIRENADLPVGQNLLNHVGVTLYMVATKLNNTQTLDWSGLTSYMLSREGPMTSTGITQVTGFLYSSIANQTLRQPDIQFFFNGFYAECSKTGMMGEVIPDTVNCRQSGYNMSANAAALLPKSRGYLTLNSTDPLDPPIFNPNFFDEPNDMVVVKDGLDYLRMIIESSKFQDEYGLELDRSTTTLCDDVGEEWSDEWEECIIRLHTDAQNHQLGTAAMGLVVDPDLKVYGIERLRVMDASVMPSQPTGNPQGAIMMVAERGADILRKIYD